MFKRIISLLLSLFLLSGSLTAAYAAEKPKITTQPNAQTIREGGSCQFKAVAQNATGTTWRLSSPDGAQDFPFTDAPTHFPGLGVSGKNSKTLTLSNVSIEMDGWLVYCRFGGDGGRVDTRKVKLTVLPQEDVQQSQTSTEENVSYVPVGGSKVIQAIGCYIQYVTTSGKAQGSKLTSIDFTDNYVNPVTNTLVNGGTLDCKITADVPSGAKIAYWVINGARYDFDMPVKSILVENLTWSMSIEVVYDNNASHTYLSDAQAVAKEANAPLLAKSKNARMSLIDAFNNPGGGYFSEFDFSYDYPNPADGGMEEGGQVDLKVIANLPEAHVVSYWKFNEAKLDFNSNVSWFVVDNLTENMLYQPVLKDMSTPVPQYTIQCTSCTFSGGGYTNATSGTVPYGTKITITPSKTSSLGYWSGTYAAGIPHDGISAKPISWTVKQNCKFVWHPEIN